MTRAQLAAMQRLATGCHPIAARHYRAIISGAKCLERQDSHGTYFSYFHGSGTYHFRPRTTPRVRREIVTVADTLFLSGVLSTFPI